MMYLNVGCLDGSIVHPRWTVTYDVFKWCTIRSKKLMFMGWTVTYDVFKLLNCCLLSFPYHRWTVTYDVFK